MAKHVVASNRKAQHDYQIIETYEAGIELLGSEVKSLRSHQASLKGSFGHVEKDEVFLYNFYIKPYDKTTSTAPDPKRKRKLLLHKKEIKKLIGKLAQRGLALIPLSVYFKKSLAKVELALCKGKRKYDKRQELKKRTHKKEIEKALKYKKR
jgi:SsrA-binding protein